MFRLSLYLYAAGADQYQTYLKFGGLPFRTVPSTNHASPTGALPFLLPLGPDSSSPSESTLPIASNKLQKWANEQGVTLEEPSDLRYDAYLTLVDHRIRNAWVCLSTSVCLIPYQTQRPLTERLSCTHSTLSLATLKLSHSVFMLNLARPFPSSQLR